MINENGLNNTDYKIKKLTSPTNNPTKNVKIYKVTNNYFSKHKSQEVYLTAQNKKKKNLSNKNGNVVKISKFSPKSSNKSKKKITPLYKSPNPNNNNNINLTNSNLNVYNNIKYNNSNNNNNYNNNYNNLSNSCNNGNYSQRVIKTEININNEEEFNNKKELNKIMSDEESCEEIESMSENNTINNNINSYDENNIHILTKTNEDNNKNSNNNENLSDYDDEVIDEREFDLNNSPLIKKMEKYHHETKFPTLSANPFMIDNNNINKNDNNSNNQTKRNSDKNVSNSTKEQKFLNHNIKEIVIDLNLDEPNTKNFVTPMNKNTILNINLNNENEQLKKLYRNLLSLSKKGDRELFLETLEKISTFSNYNIDYQDENGYSAIHYCCIEGNLKIVEILLSKL